MHFSQMRRAVFPLSPALTAWAVCVTIIIEKTFT